jgi:glycosyltransferase involved in cell wall biosynthesis
VLFLIPQVNAYWKDVLLAWRRSENRLQVRIGAVTPVDTDLALWGTWIERIGPGLRPRPMYYGKLRQGYPTPLLSLFRQLWTVRPSHVVVYGFSGWTLVACVGRRLGLWKRLTLLWEGSTPGVDMKADRLRQALRRWALTCADEACTQSQAGAEYLVSLRPSISLRVRPWLCVNPARFVARTRPNSTEVVRMVFVGSLEKRKGVDFLLAVLADLPGNWQLDLIGPQSGPLLHCADPRIRRVGPRSPEEIQAGLGEFDVFLSPSREDTWGVAPIEAAAAGLLVVVSTEVPSRVERPHWLALPLDQACWRQALKQIVAAPEEALRQGGQARDHETTLYARAVPPWLGQGQGS